MKSLAGSVALGGVAAFAIFGVLGNASGIFNIPSGRVQPPAAAVAEPAPAPEPAAPRLETAAITVAPVAVAPAVPPATQQAVVAAAAPAQPAQPADAVLASTFASLGQPAPRTAPAPRAVVPAATQSAESSAAAAARTLAGVPTTALAYAPQPAPRAIAPNRGVRVGADQLNVRSGPSTSAARLFSLDAGEAVTVKARSNSGWVLLATAAGREGWVDRTYLDGLDYAALPVEAAAAAPAKPEPKATGLGTRTVAGSGVTVRSGPGKSNRSLFALSAGSKVTVKAEKGGWLQVTDAKGRTGWAYSSFLR
jgi:uncharacterized protein YgiM (DUF1202 family)